MAYQLLTESYQIHLKTDFNILGLMASKLILPEYLLKHENKNQVSYCKTNFFKQSSFCMGQTCYFIFLFAIMSNQETNAKDKNIRRLIKCLSQVSAVDASQIRKDAIRTNQRRIKFSEEKDRLLRNQQETHLPNLLFNYKLFSDKNKKIENFSEKSIQNQAYLKRANFEIRKIQIKKESIARKHHLSYDRYLSTPQLERERSSIADVRKINIQEIFQDANNEIYEPDNELLKRIKTKVDSSKQQVKRLYDSHCKIVRQGFNYKKTPRLDALSDKDHLCTTRTKNSLPDDNLIYPMKTIIFKGNNEKSSSLAQMIRISTDRSKELVNNKAFQLTTKERLDMQATQDLIIQMQGEIETNNKLKESIVFGQLKKILYGDRKGRFIQDNTFRTRLKGQYSDEYMKIVKQQENILNEFNGSFLNRRNLVEKFSNILGTIRKVDKVTTI